MSWVYFCGEPRGFNVKIHTLLLKVDLWLQVIVFHAEAASIILNWSYLCCLPHLLASKSFSKISKPYNGN